MSLVPVQQQQPQQPEGPTMEDRKKALKHLGAGAALWGAGKGGENLVERHYEKKGQEGVIRALRHGRAHMGHARKIGLKFAASTASASGMPLIGYGAYNAVKPQGKVKDFDARRDVIKPTVRRLSLKEARDEGIEIVGKELKASETNELVHRKERGRKLSLASGTMGLTALALRTPELARQAAKVKGLKNVGALHRLAAKEPGATKASNALGIAAIGTGSLGSFNYARQQKLEAKDVVASKAADEQLILPGMPEKEVRARRMTGKRVWTTPTGKREVVFDEGPSHVDGLNKIRRTHPKTGAESRIVTSTKRLGSWVRKDFLEQNRQHISPEAEEGYKTLRGLKRRDDIEAGASAVGSSVAAAGAGNNLRLGNVNRKRAALWAVPAAAGIYSTHRSIDRSKRIKARMDKIEAKAAERKAAGTLGRGRSVEKADEGHKVAGGALMAAGTGAVVAGGSSKRIMDTVYNRGVARADEYKAQRLARIGQPRQNDKAGKAAIQRVNATHKKAVGRLAERTGGSARTKLLWAGLATGVPAAYAGARLSADPVRKADKRDVDAAAAGGVVGAGLYQGAGYAGKVVDSRLAERVKANPTLKARLSQHYKDVGMPRSEHNAQAATNKFYRTMPKGIPGYRWHRMRGQMFAGKRGAAATVTAAGLGATAGVKAKRHGEDVEKAFSFRAMNLGGGMRRPPRARKPSINPSYIGTSVTGKKFTVRGSVR